MTSDELHFVMEKIVRWELKPVHTHFLSPVQPCCCMLLLLSFFFIKLIEMNTKEIYLLVNKTWALQMYSKNIGFYSKGTIRLKRRGIICRFIIISVLWKFLKKKLKKTCNLSALLPHCKHLWLFTLYDQYYFYSLISRAMKDLDLQELPPLVYQLLLLSTKVFQSRLHQNIFLLKGLVIDTISWVFCRVTKNFFWKE